MTPPQKQQDDEEFVDLEPEPDLFGTDDLIGFVVEPERPAE